MGLCGLYVSPEVLACALPGTSLRSLSFARARGQPDRHTPQKTDLELELVIFCPRVSPLCALSYAKL